MKRSRAGAFAAGLAVVTLVGVGALPAAGAAPVSGRVSATQAGYLVRGPGIHQIRARWVVPHAVCGHGSTYADVQVGLARANPIVRLGTSANCKSGSPSYAAWWTTIDLTRQVVRRVQPGDHMRAVLSWHRLEASMEIDDLTQGWGFGMGIADAGVHIPTRVSFGLAARSSSQGPRPLTDVGTVRFSRCTVSGNRITAGDAQAVTMRRDDVVRARPGAIDPPGAFDVSWRHT